MQPIEEQRGRHHMLRVLERVLHRLNQFDDMVEISANELLNDSDYEPSENSESDATHVETPDKLTNKQLSLLTHFIVKKKQTDTMECAVCLETLRFRQHCRELKCKHIFHKKCIDQWLKRDARCPTCRTSVDPKELLMQPTRHSSRIQPLPASF